MKGWKRLENINPVSGKLREAQCDPYLTIAIGSFPASKISYRVPSTVTCTQK
jgi:hypothetical protein